MTSPLTNVARALAGHFGPDFDDLAKDPVERKHRANRGGLGFSGHDQTDVLQAARAVISAMREPSEAMIRVGIHQAEECTDDWTASAACAPGHIYAAMIDAAFSDD